MTKKIIPLIALSGIGVALLINFFRADMPRSLFKSVGEPLFFLSISLFIVSVLLFFVKEEVFRSWLRFSYWWIPLAMISVILVRDSHGFLALGKEDVAIFFSVLFFVISLCIIVVRSFQLRKK